MGLGTLADRVDFGDEIIITKPKSVEVCAANILSVGVVSNFMAKNYHRQGPSSDTC